MLPPEKNRQRFLPSPAKILIDSFLKRYHDQLVAVTLFLRRCLKTAQLQAFLVDEL